MYSHTTFIAGIPYRKPDLSVLKVGDLVSIVREPDNKFDPNALKVIYANIHLGYIPRRETGQWQDIPTAFIVEIDPSRKWTEVKISTEAPNATTR